MYAQKRHILSVMIGARLYEYVRARRDLPVSSSYAEHLNSHSCSYQFCYAKDPAYHFYEKAHRFLHSNRSNGIENVKSNIEARKKTPGTEWSTHKTSVDQNRRINCVLVEIAGIV